jgi:hypothetical protein
VRSPVFLTNELSSLFNPRVPSRRVVMVESDNFSLKCGIGRYINTVTPHEEALVILSQEGVLVIKYVLYFGVPGFFLDKLFF